MIEIAKLPADDRREMFYHTEAKTGLPDALVGKDFLGCFALVYLFPRSPWEKGGPF